MIRSSKVAAGQIATKMENAADAIQTATNKTINTADRTTLTVNKKAIQANQEAIQLATAFNQAFLQTIADLHSVAGEFERTDQELGTEFIVDFLEDLMTYTKAKNG